jgi:hypothetical protein
MAETIPSLRARQIAIGLPSSDRLACVKCSTSFTVGEADGDGFTAQPVV